MGNKDDVIKINRSTHQAMHYYPLPYPHKAETEEQWRRILDIAQMNVLIAARELDTIWRCYKFWNPPPEAK